VTGSDAELRWFDAQGKQLKSAPAAAKTESAETLKELKGDLKDIQAMLAAQRERIDSLFPEQKSWPVAVWRERYVDHPLVGTIARHLIWEADGVSITVVDGAPANVEGCAVELAPDATIRMWHPAERLVEEVWHGGAISNHSPSCNFQTGAPRDLSAYRCRAADVDILKPISGTHPAPHQLNALCAAPRWKNKLRTMVDDTYPPASRVLPAWNLRAEFWIEGIGQEYGQDTNDSGAYLRLVSDQVRFYRIDAAQNQAHAGGGGYSSRGAGPGQKNINEPLPLAEIPLLVFSETLRDVDLFVGVASVGNDPTWQDGGPGGRYMDYWRQYSFGELSESAVSRRDVLERLLPRLRIAKQCRIDGKFLIVKGSRRAYKIHLGSGNILMEPNNQYLCIVPDSSARVSTGSIYLPFEGTTRYRSF
jgi:hypothetical protein